MNYIKLSIPFAHRYNSKMQMYGLEKSEISDKQIFLFMLYQMKIMPMLVQILLLCCLIRDFCRWQRIVNPLTNLNRMAYNWKIAKCYHITYKTPDDQVYYHLSSSIYINHSKLIYINISSVLIYTTFGITPRCPSNSHFFNH